MSLYARHLSSHTAIAEEKIRELTEENRALREQLLSANRQLSTIGAICSDKSDEELQKPSAFVYAVESLAAELTQIERQRDSLRSALEGLLRIISIFDDVLGHGIEANAAREALRAIAPQNPEKG